MIRSVIPTRFLPAFALGIVAAACVAALLWGLEAPVAQAQSQSQAFDSGGQRMEMIRELRVANDKLTEISQLLREIRDQGLRAPGTERAPRGSVYPTSQVVPPRAGDRP